MKFTLKIELGNETMQNYSQILNAIRISFASIVPFRATNDCNAQEDDTGLVHDENGNTVGKWEVTDDSSDVFRCRACGRAEEDCS